MKTKLMFMVLGVLAVTPALAGSANAGGMRHVEARPAASVRAHERGGEVRAAGWRRPEFHRGYAAWGRPYAGGYGYGYRAGDGGWGRGRVIVSRPPCRWGHYRR
jgi:hypothetical protein